MFYNAGELVEIGRWIGISAPTAADTVIDSCTSFVNGSENSVSGAEVVARRFFRICSPFRKDNVRVAGLYYAGTLAGIWDEPGEEGVGLLELRSTSVGPMKS